MTKKIAVLGKASLRATLITALAAMGHSVVDEDDMYHKPILPKGKHKPIGNCYDPKPVNGYQKKQRNRKRSKRI